MFKRFFFIFIPCLLFAPLSAFAQDPLSIVTYYSSPNGVYNRLSAQAAGVQVLGVGDTNGDLGFDASDAPDPTTESGQAWISGGLSVGNISTSELVNASWDSLGIFRSIAIFESGPAAGDIQLIIRQDINRNRIEMQVQDGGGNPQPLVFNQNGGAVGIGDDSPSTDLDIEGNLNVSGTLKVDMTTVACDFSTEATIRYNSGTFQWCDGANWQPFNP